jgi:hypothetical protein
MEKKNKILFSISLALSLSLCCLSGLGYVYYFGFWKKDSKQISAHFSVDDTIAIFQDLSKTNYNSIFENSTLSYLKKVHEEYNAVFSLYCFYKTDDFDLSTLDARYANEFSQNSSWLRFGFHAYDDSEDLNTQSLSSFKDETNSFYSAIDRITGGKSRDSFLRLSYFRGTKEQLKWLSNYGTYGFYGPDDQRNAYYFDSEMSRKITETSYVKDDDLYFIPTYFRFENVSDTYKTLENFNSSGRQYLEIFTHEYLLSSKAVEYGIDQACQFIKNYDYSFQFPTLK